MDIWTFAPDTGELLPGNPRIAQEIWNRRHLPMDDPRRWGVPQNATAIAPPEDREGFARCFVDGEWRHVEDLCPRDPQTGARRPLAVYDTATKERRTFFALGPLPDGVTDKEPGPFDIWDEGAAAWFENAALKRADTVPASITPRQLLIGLMTQGLITEAEAIAAAQAGTVPASVQRIFDGLPTAEERAIAAITWAKMTVVERDHPMVAALAEANDLSESDVDAFFQACAKI